MRNCTKDIDFKPLGIILLSILFIGTVTFIKYKPVYTVSVAGETLGYVNEKSELDDNLKKYISHREGTVDLITISNMPKYNLELVLRNTETKEKEILEKIEETAIITYKTYAITVNNEQINEVSSKEEAETIIANLQSDLKEGVEFNLGIVEVYKDNEQNFISKDSAYENLNNLKIAKIEEYEAELARQEAERKAKEEAERMAKEEAERKRKAEIYANKVVAVSVSYGTGNISGINLSNPLRTTPLITSRFGEVSSRRHSAHTGLDLATALGTPIFPISSGKVVFSGIQGNYGNMIIIEHGDGIQSWYGHCNTLNVGVGTEVTADTLIATVGNTGNSTGPHLHLEIRVNGNPVNPQNYIY